MQNINFSTNFSFYEIIKKYSIVACEGVLTKRVLVTGGAGFIGSHLCEKLLQENNFVICLDNFFTGSKKNIEHLLDNKNFQLVESEMRF